MSLKHAMLGFIDMIPLSGYDLKKMFDSSVRFYWTATHSQIYRTLNEMNRDGLTEIERVQQIDSPNKKIYHITEKGKEELRNWIRESSDLPPVRHKLLVQLSWADRLETAEIIGVLEAYADKLKERLALYYSHEHREVLRMSRSEREQFLWQSTLDNGIVSYEAEFNWARKTIEGLKRFKN